MSQVERVIEPVVKTVHVAASPERTFEVFTGRISDWWPLELHSIFGERARSATIEPHVGGRVIERAGDGEEVSWGEVLAFDPPRRLALAWKPNTRPTPPTAVEVTFTEDGDGTLVRLVHTGWELLGDDAAEARESYEQGWSVTLDRFLGAMEEA